MQQVHAEQPSVHDARLPKSSELSGSKNKYHEINIRLDGNLGETENWGWWHDQTGRKLLKDVSKMQVKIKVKELGRGTEPNHG